MAEPQCPRCGHAEHFAYDCGFCVEFHSRDCPEGEQEPDVLRRCVVTMRASDPRPLRPRAAWTVAPGMVPRVVREGGDG